MVERLLATLRKVTNQRYNLYKLVLSQQSSMFQDCECGVSQPLHLDEVTGAADVTLDFPPCPTD